MVIAQTVTVRLVRSFEYKTVRNVYFKDLDLDNTTLEELKRMVDDRVKTTDNLRFLEKIPFDTLKIYSQPHGAKTSNPVINLSDDEKLLLPDWSKSLSSLGFQNETEVSLFVKSDYEAYKSNPVFKW
jgi:hypothetical protein